VLAVFVTDLKSRLQLQRSFQNAEILTEATGKHADRRSGPTQPLQAVADILQAEPTDPPGGVLLASARSSYL
jgi:hypothetical protein